ncbi:TadE family protein [Microbacterium betulae]|uniref:TadE family protein n=1 Tax=Microbacterium betulae TaxID=2981139 RepID=A0AA97FEL2_9MICO|nr:TadE family protein [Microbacterium sp. AB]WOF21698.1 TadE family protein [Microbacterium sp. AB]
MLGDDAGSAAIEFLLAGIVMLVPLAYLVVVLGEVQEQTLGVEATARHAAHTLARTGGLDETFSRLPAVIGSVSAEYGIDPDEMDLSIVCTPARTTCPEAGASVSVTIGADVRLPFVPPLLGLDRFLAIPVEATSVQKVSRFWGGS